MKAHFLQINDRSLLNLLVNVDLIIVSKSMINVTSQALKIPNQIIKIYIKEVTNYYLFSIIASWTYQSLEYYSKQKARTIILNLIYEIIMFNSFYLFIHNHLFMNIYHISMFLTYMVQQKIHWYYFMFIHFRNQNSLKLKFFMHLLH